MNANYRINDVYAFLLEDSKHVKMFTEADFGGSLNSLRAFAQAFLDAQFDGVMTGTKMTMLGRVDERTCN